VAAINGQHSFGQGIDLADAGAARGRHHLSAAHHVLGKKFGKTEEGAVWLNAARTSPYQMYQYWLQTADADVVRFLKLFTFLDRERIEALGNETQCRPEAREAQRVLAAECTTIVHGAETVRAVEAASRILFSASNEVPTHETITLLSRESAGDGDYASGSRYGDRPGGSDDSH